MFFRTLSAAIAVATFVSAALAPAAGRAMTTVKEVAVRMDVTAIANERAAAYWARAADDLENAIVARVTERMDKEKGAKVSVDIDGLALASSFESQLNIADSAMSGKVNVTSDNGANKVGVYNLKVSFADAVPMLPAGVEVAKVTYDSPEYYAAMINAFADAVVVQLD